MSLDDFNNAVQNIPYWDEISNLYEYNMGEHFTTKDPFYQKFPEKNPATLKPHEKMTYQEKRRKPPPYITEKQRKLWKQVMKRAWYHDRNFCGCMPIDLGCGMISFVSIFPLIGSIIAYKMHYKLIKACHQAGAPAYLKAEMVGNIGLDFAMTLVPLLGVLMSWMKASSTRNAALFDTWLREQSNEQHMKRMAEIQKQKSAPVPQRGEVRPSVAQNTANGAPNRAATAQNTANGAPNRAATAPNRVPTTQKGTATPNQASNSAGGHTRAPPSNTSAPSRSQPGQNRSPQSQAKPSAQATRQPVKTAPQAAKKNSGSSSTVYPPGTMHQSTSQAVPRKPVPSQQPPAAPLHKIKVPERAATSQVHTNPERPFSGPPLPPKVPLDSLNSPPSPTHTYPQPPQPAAGLGKPPPVPKKVFYPPPAGIYP